MWRISMEAALAQQIADARELAAAGQPANALVYFETLLPQLTRCECDAMPAAW